MNEDLMYQKQAKEKIIRDGAGWFYWIAVLSIVNSLIVLFGGKMNFIIGLGITQVIDGYAFVLSENYNSNVIKIVGLLLNVFISCIFVVFGILSNKKHRWAFLTGMILYALDGLIFFIGPDFFSIGFHIFALFFIFKGFRETKNLKEIKKQIYEQSQLQADLNEGEQNNI